MPPSIAPKKEIGLVAKADFGVGIFHRESGERSDVGHYDAARTRDDPQARSLISKLEYEAIE